MARIVLTADEEKDAMAKGSSELKFLMGREDIDVKIQAKFYHVGITTPSKLASFASDLDDFKDVLKTELGLDAQADLKTRVIVAALCVVYKVSGTRSDKVAEYEGELEAKRMPKPMSNNDYLSMKEAWEKKWWSLEDCNTPARCYLEKRAEELESGDMRAETLQSVLNREQDDFETLQPVWDSAGNLRVKKGAHSIPEPMNPEELRRRLLVMFTGLMMLGFKHTNRSFLQDITPQLHQDYCSYLLGEWCWELVAKDTEGNVVATPSWKLLLAYELALRKRAYKLVADGQDFKTSLNEAMKDPLVKERNFTTPLALQSSAASSTTATSRLKRNWSGSESMESSPWRKTKGKGKGKGKAKGSAGKGKGMGKWECASATPDGQAICYAFNDAYKRCKNKACKFVHVCGRCFLKHPLYQCQGNRAMPPMHSGETQGGGEGAK